MKSKISINKIIIEAFLLLSSSLGASTNMMDPIREEGDLGSSDVPWDLQKMIEKTREETIIIYNEKCRKYEEDFKGKFKKFLENKYNPLKVECDSLKEENKLLIERRDRLLKIQEGLDREKDLLQQDKQELKERLTKSEQELKKSEEQFKQKSKELNEIRTENWELKAKLEVIETKKEYKIEEITKQLSAKDKEIQDLKDQVGKLSEKDSKIRELQNKLSEKDAELSYVEKEAAEYDRHRWSALNLAKGCIEDHKESIDYIKEKGEALEGLANQIEKNNQSLAQSGSTLGAIADAACSFFGLGERRISSDTTTLPALEDGTTVTITEIGENEGDSRAISREGLPRQA